MIASINKTKLVYNDLKLSLRDMRNAKKLIELYFPTLKTPKALLDFLEESNDFPDYELANNIEEASKEFRRNFKLNIN